MSGDVDGDVVGGVDSGVELMKTSHKEQYPGYCPRHALSPPRQLPGLGVV